MGSAIFSTSGAQSVYTSRWWKLRVFKGTYPDSDRFPYHDLLDCDRIWTTIDSSVMLSVPVKRPNPLVGEISESRPTGLGKPY